MDYEYISPVFKNLSPIQINDSLKEIKSSKNYSSYTRIKTQYKDSFNLSFSKFKNDEALNIRNYSILIYNLDLIIEEGYNEIFIRKMSTDTSIIDNYHKLIRPLLYHIYNISVNADVQKQIFIVLKNICNKLKAKDEYKHVVRSIRRYDSLENYMQGTEKKISRVKDISDIKGICQKFYIKENDDFFLKSTVPAILKYHDKEELNGVFKRYINNMDLNLQNIIFAKIIEDYIKSKYSSKCIDLWFEEIESLLQDPYSKGNTRYFSFNDKHKDVYRIWNNKRNINKYFHEQEKQRFYSDYINYIYRIEYFEKLKESIVIELENHTLIECNVGKKSLYIYKKNIIDIEKLNFYCEKYNKTQCLSIFKDKSKIEKIITEKDDYLERINEELNKYGYKL